MAFGTLLLALWKHLTTMKMGWVLDSFGLLDDHVEYIQLDALI
jgi:hypothetical protein